jgi:F-type H+-transporting ATPase subunit alpha
MAVLNKGRRNVEILKQPQYSPMRVEHQVAILFCGTQNLMRNVPVRSIIDFEAEFLHHLDDNYKDILKELAQGKLTDEAIAVLKKVSEEISHKYKE